MALITDLDDRTLVEQHRAGDPDAFRRIVVRHHRSLYANALRRLGDPVAAEDAVQDAFIRAFRNLKHFDGDYHLDAWLHRIVTNTCHDIGRRRGRDTRLFDRACTEVEVEAAPADEALDAMPREQINEALDSLPESYREVLVLRFVDELSYSDVADKAGISEQNARARVSRGRTMLKRLLTSTSGLVVWAIPPLRRHAQLGGAETEAANQAAVQVQSLASLTTIATSAPAPISTFTQVSGIIAQAGPAIATAAPAVSTTAPALKAAMAVGIAASMAIPAGVAVDRAREKPLAPFASEMSDSVVEAAGAPVIAESAAPEAASPSTSTPVQVEAMSTGPGTVVDTTGTDTGEASTPTTTVTPTSEPTPSTSTTPPPADEAEGETVAPAPEPEPAAEPSGEEAPPAAEPAPTAPPGQLSASLTVAPAGERLEVSGPMKLEIGEEVLAGQLTGKLHIAPADPKDRNGEREVYRSDLTLRLDDGRVLELTVHGFSTVTTHGNSESHALVLTFALQAPEELQLADTGTLEGTFVTERGAGELGLAIPGATQDT